MGQIFNVLTILAITLLMAVATTTVAYFVDFVPSVIDSGTQVASNTPLYDSSLD